MFPLIGITGPRLSGAGRAVGFDPNFDRATELAGDGVESGLSLAMANATGPRNQGVTLASVRAPDEFITASNLPAVAVTVTPPPLGRGTQIPPAPLGLGK